ncbi:single-stranded DNA-binding protein [Mesoplasma photuris]|uniref:single-stranded DNA-binding protein n=1 Tax=Mesoplasma photuris TaxID=217731 RepID=UPI0004E25931|nr:single-stranded DNA-binding protein [Mesoplasma photuris]
MNLVNLIGQIEGDAQIAYESKDGGKKLYKFTVKIPKSYRGKNGESINDYVNVKAWADNLDEEFGLFDQAIVGIEGKVHSFGNTDKQNFGNEIIATRVLYLN